MIKQSLIEIHLMFEIEMQKRAKRSMQSATTKFAYNSKTCIVSRMKWSQAEVQINFISYRYDRDTKYESSLYIVAFVPYLDSMCTL